MKVYLLTSGEYSDWRVEAVYDEKHLEDAKRVVEICGFELYPDGPEEEPYELNHYDVPQHPVGCEYYDVIMTKDGKVDQCSILSKLEEGRVRKRHVWLMQHPDGIRVRGYFRSGANAIQFTNDMRVGVLAGSILASSGGIIDLERVKCVDVNAQ